MWFAYLRLAVATSSSSSFLLNKSNLFTILVHSSNCPTPFFTHSYAETMRTLTRDGFNHKNMGSPK